MKKLLLSFAIISGGLIFAQQNQPRLTPEQREAKRAEMHQKMDDRQKEHLAKMQKDLNLSNAQVQQIQALQDKNRAEREANMQKHEKMRAEKMEQMKAKRAEHDAEMQKILTPDQYKKWQQQRVENMQNRMDKMKMRDGKRGGSRGKGMKNPDFGNQEEFAK